MAVQWDKIGGLLRGLATLAENPDARDAFLGRMLELSKKAGKAAALQALANSGVDAATQAAAKAELDRAFPD